MNDVIDNMIAAIAHIPEELEKFCESTADIMVRLIDELKRILKNVREFMNQRTRPEASPPYLTIRKDSTATMITRLLLSQSPRAPPSPPCRQLIFTEIPS